MEPNGERQLFICCDCGDCQHQFILYWPADDDGGWFALQVHLITWENIFRRLWTAVRYVFGYKCRYGHWDEVIVDRRAAKSMRAFIEDFLMAPYRKAA